MSKLLSEAVMAAPSHPFGDASPSAGDHWLQSFDEAPDAHRGVDRPMTPPTSSKVGRSVGYATERVVLFRFDDDLAAHRTDLGHRILFSAREEDEHPDLVGTEDVG